MRKTLNRNHQTVLINALYDAIDLKFERIEGNDDKRYNAQLKKDIKVIQSLIKFSHIESEGIQDKFTWDIK